MLGSFVGNNGVRDDHAGSHGRHPSTCDIEEVGDCTDRATRHKKAEEDVEELDVVSDGQIGGGGGLKVAQLVW